MTDCHSGLRAVRLETLRPETLRPEMLCLIPAGIGAPGSAPEDALTIRVRHEPNYVLAAVAGEIDIATVARLRARLWALAASPQGRVS
jgi:hypothetical protein